MSEIIPVLRAVVRDELAGVAPLSLGVVTAVYTNEGGRGDTNLAIDARLRGSALELQHLPLAVGRLGLSVVPRPGDLVLVGFVDGDLNGPVALGFLYDEQVRPPDAGPDEVVYVVPDDARRDARRLHVELPNGNSVTVGDQRVTVTMGATTLSIEADGKVAVEAKGDLSLRAGGSLSLQADGDVTVRAATSVTVEGGTEAKLKGARTTIAGMTNFAAG